MDFALGMVSKYRFNHGGSGWTNREGEPPLCEWQTPQKWKETKIK